jgi:hypothetical protein
MLSVSLMIVGFHVNGPERSQRRSLVQKQGDWMSFQAYISNIQAKTGKSPEDFKELGEAKGFVENGVLREGVKAGAIIAWLKEDFQLGHGHAMAIVALFKGKTE